MTLQVNDEAGLLEPLNRKSIVFGYFGRCFLAKPRATLGDVRPTKVPKGDWSTPGWYTWLDEKLSGMANKPLAPQRTLR